MSDPGRDRLRDAIAARQAEEARLAALEEAQSKAHREMWHASSKLQDAEETLRRATRDEGQRRVYSYLNNEAPDTDPVAEATQIVNAARAEVARLEKLEADMAAEISRVQASLRDRRIVYHGVLAELVTHSPEYQALIASHKAAWQRLRTVKTALRTVTHGLHGHVEQRFIDEAEISEPLEIRVGYPVDAEFVGAWQKAMSQLEVDADADLPHDD
jgi:chromosome segregation ATPase